MAKIKCKGTAIKQDLAGTFTAIAQVLSIDGPETEIETFDATSLDSGIGKEYQQTGYVEGGSLTFEMFWDPALAGHQNITDIIAAPADENWKLVFSDSTEWPFTSAGISITQTTKMNDGLKATVKLKVDGMITFPT